MNLIEILTQHEGKRKYPYTDTTGHVSIGVGRNLTDKGLSEDEIQYLLSNDIKEARSELDRVFPDWKELSEARQTVLISMMFNLGAPNYLTFHKFWKAMLEKDYDTASAEMLDSRWAEQVGSRADYLSELMRKGEE